MKKIIYGVLMYSAFFFSSCSKEESNVSPSSKEVLLEVTTPNGESIFTNFVANDGKSYSITKYDLSRMKPSSRRGLSTIIPRTASGQLSKHLTNAKLIITGSPYYTTGTYFCDVYKSEATITVPSGSFALYTPATGASIKGYASFNNTTSEGSVASQFGNTYVFTTYSIIPKFNILGQNISGPTIPRDLTGNVFSYLEFTP